MGNDDLKIHSSISGAVHEAVRQKQSKLEGGHIYKIMSENDTSQYTYCTKDQASKLQNAEKMSFTEIKKTWREEGLNFNSANWALFKKKASFLDKAMAFVDKAGTSFKKSFSQVATPISQSSPMTPKEEKWVPTKEDVGPRITEWQYQLGVVVEEPKKNHEPAKTDQPTTVKAPDARPAAPIAKHEHIIAEIKSTEVSFQGNLAKTVQVLTELNRADPSDKTVSKALFDYTHLLNMSNQLLGKFNAAQNNPEAIANVYSTPEFRLYSLALKECNKNFSDFSKELPELLKNTKDKPLKEKCTELLGVQSLGDLLITPVQRMPRHVLLLRDLGESSPPNTEKAFEKATSMVKKYADEINQAVGKQEVTAEIMNLTYLIEGIDSKHKLRLNEANELSIEKRSKTSQIAGPTSYSDKTEAKDAKALKVLQERIALLAKDNKEVAEGLLDMFIKKTKMNS